jgi:hypothetical protein
MQSEDSLHTVEGTGVQGLQSPARNRLLSWLEHETDSPRKFTGSGQPG